MGLCLALGGFPPYTYWSYMHLLGTLCRTPVFFLCTALLWEYYPVNSCYVDLPGFSARSPQIRESTKLLDTHSLNHGLKFLPRHSVRVTIGFTLYVSYLQESLSSIAWCPVSWNHCFLSFLQCFSCFRRRVNLFCYFI